jgi:hypothetical protein
MSRRFPRRSGPLIALAVVLIAGLLLYLPGINGPFLFDDYHNFIQNPFVQIEQLDLDSALDAAYSGGGRFPARGLSRLSFALNYYYSGGVFDQRAFKLTNIVIHLLNAVLVFALARALFMRRYAASRERAVWMALLTAGVWLLHPLQLTSVLYSVQRMTSLSALFMFLGLLGYVYGRRQVQDGENRGFVLMAFAIGAGTILGVLNKENAALLPFLAFVVHLAFFPTAALEPGMRRRLRAFHLLFVGSALLLAIGAVAWSWSGIMASFEYDRDFTMGERLLTQPRVLFLYLSLFMFPSLRRMSLHHDDLIASSGLFSPLSTALAIVLLLALLAFAVYRLRNGAIWAFAVIFFIVGHAMESSFLSLEMVHEHRNYVPSFALAMLVAYALTQFTLTSKRPVMLATVVGLAVMLGISVVTWARVGMWSNEAWLMRYMTEQHPNSYRALSVSARGIAAAGGTVSEVFVAYGKIAHANPMSIFPLMRMRRLVNAMQFQIKEGSIAPLLSVTTAVETEQWDTQVLYSDLAQLDKVATALDAEIKRRLPLSPVHNETLAEFLQIRQCIAAQLDLCSGLDDEFQGWMRVALSQSRMSSRARARILDQVAWQQQRSGDFDNAHAALREASELTSNTIFGLRRVLIFVKQKKFDEAERLLQQIDGMKGRARVNLREARRIREYLGQARDGELSVPLETASTAGRS